jgi:RimJ/RimL family protein N-acetyltransferase
LLPGDVTLRGVEEDDLSIFFEDQLDPDANRMGGFTPRDRDAFMAHWAKIMDDPNVITRTVLFEGEVAGNVVSFDGEDHRLVGYWIGTKHWGKGIATKALLQFLDVVETRPLFAHAAKTNPASVRVLEKCGFAIVGTDTFENAGEQLEELILRLDG